MMSTTTTTSLPAGGLPRPNKRPFNPATVMPGRGGVNIGINNPQLRSYAGVMNKTGGAGQPPVTITGVAPWAMNRTTAAAASASNNSGPNSSASLLLPSPTSIPRGDADTMSMGVSSSSSSPVVDNNATATATTSHKALPSVERSITGRGGSIALLEYIAKCIPTPLDGAAGQEEWYVFCPTVLPFLVLMSLLSLYIYISACLHSLTPHGTSLTIITTQSINHRHNTHILNTLQVRRASGRKPHTPTFSFFL